MPILTCAGFNTGAFYDAAHGVTEMQPVSLRDQKVYLEGLSIFLRTGRYYLHSLPDFTRLHTVQYLKPIVFPVEEPQGH